MSETGIRTWPSTGFSESADYRIFQARRETRISPVTGRTHEFSLIDCPAWVNVIALTDNGHIVMVKQFRHGTNTVELEIPGGMIDPGDPSPVAAGVRELEEETGYVGRDPELIGRIYPNPAIQNNFCHTVLVHGCEPRGRTAFDPGEDIETRLEPAGDMPAMVADGRVTHALVAVAFLHYQNYLARQTFGTSEE